MGFLPAAIVLALWLVLLPQSGGFYARDWMPAALVNIGVLAAVIVGVGHILPPGRSVRVALGAFAAVVVLNFLGITWSRTPGVTWEGATQLLYYLAGAWTLALAPWTGRSAERAMLAFTACCALLCALSLLGALRAEDLSTYFSEDRWAAPLGYPNGLAALAAIAALPGLVISARRGLGPVGQAVGLGSATFLVGFALLPQSRGSLIGTAVAVVVVLALVPWRWRMAGRLVIAGFSIVLAGDPVLDVYRALEGDGTVVSPALEEAAVSLFLAAVVGAAGGGLLGLLDRRVVLPHAADRALGVGKVVVAGAVAVGLVVAAVATSGAVGDELSSQWRQLANPGVETQEAEYQRRLREAEAGGGVEEGGSRLLSTSPFERYDYWRVSVEAFKDAPFGGIGAGAFEQRYTATRRFPKLSRHPHNVTLRVLAENGLLGMLGVLTMLGALGWTLLRGLRDASDEVRAIVGAAAGALAYFLAHGSFDWIEEFPVMGGPVAGFLFVAAVARVREERGGAPLRLPVSSPNAARLRTAAIALVTLLCLGAVVPQWLAVRWRERAVQSWRIDAPAAYDDLRRADRINPLAIDAAISEGAIALSLRDNARAKRAFRRALERQEHWFPYFQLALLEAADGRWQAATRQLEKAAALDAEDPSIEVLQKQISGRRRPDPAKFNRQLYDTPLFRVRKLS